jgi:hypothetical protein
MIGGKKTYIMALAVVFATMGLLVSPSFTGNAFAHAHMTLTPDIENVNPISVTIGHTDEPTFGVKPGVHDGKHNLEVFLEDANTTLPLSGANLTVDKYYFADIDSFEGANSVDEADQIETNVTVEEAFGEPGHYVADQIMQPGIYGYRLYGTIDYFGIANVTIDTTTFCSMGSEGGSSSGNTSKFNSEGWEGDYGCTGNIEDLYWPNESNLTRSTSSDAGDAELQQTGGTPALQMLAIGATVAVGGFFGFRAFRNNNK